MSASFRRIDYSLRPAKHAERRMLTEIFRRLRPFQPVETYAYVGLGSLWFSDFILFHRTLGITDMLSIERERNAEARIEANRPFGAVKVWYDESSVVLPQLDWSKRSFVWLDYDDPLSPGMLLDCQTVASRARSGTVLALSIQCHRAREVDEAEREPAAASAYVRFRDRFGTQFIPQDASEDDLSGWPFGKLSRYMVSAKIESALSVRNLNVGEERQTQFTPICSIEYEDGVKMTTMVGIFSQVSEQQRVQECGFNALDFVVEAARPVRIRVPVLTMREIRHLERQLPAEKHLEPGTIPAGDAASFAEFYRYLPNFAVLES